MTEPLCEVCVGKGGWACDCEASLCLHDNYRVKCKACNGTGHRPACPHGCVDGMIQESEGHGQMTGYPCPKCHGHAKPQPSECPACEARAERVGHPELCEKHMMDCLLTEPAPKPSREGWLTRGHIEQMTRGIDCRTAFVDVHPHNFMALCRMALAALDAHKEEKL